MTDFAAWDKKAGSMVREAEAEEAEEKAKSDAALGLDGKPRGPPTEKAKKELTELSELSEAKKAILHAHGCMPGQEDPREVVLRGPLEGSDGSELAPEAASGKAVRFLGLEGARLLVPEVAEGSAPVLKIFVENCRKCSLRIQAKLAVGVLELFNCEGLTTEVEAGPLETVQADNCKDCTLGFHHASDLGAVYHASCPGLKIRAGLGVEATSVAPPPVVAEDGSVSSDARQFVSSAPPREGRLETKLVLRGENDYPLSFPSSFIEQMPTPVRQAASSTQGPATPSTKASASGYPTTQAGLLAAGEDERRAALKKQEGNEAFKNSDFVQAAALYTEALHHDPKMYVAFANRAQCFLKMGDPEKALQDSERCIEVCPAEFAKGHFRMGMALHAMKRYGEAVPALVEAEKRDPKNKQIQEAIKMAGMMARKQAEGR